MYKILWESDSTGRTLWIDEVFDKARADQVVLDLNTKVPEIKHWTEAETFDEWCSRKAITGNYKEALFHRCMAAGAEKIEIHEELESMWESQWKDVLKSAMVKLNPWNHPHDGWGKEGESD